VIQLDLPPAVSVNRTRRVDFGNRQSKEWVRRADAMVHLAKCRPDNPLKLVPVSRFELRVVLNEKNRLDLDNSLKLVIDFLRRINLIVDDSPKHMRRIVVEMGEAPTGVRVTIIPLEGA
jgi:Holliday junction resolvase RusA-like endonuclease